MHTTDQLIDMLRDSLSVPSDRQVATHLELGRSAVSFWRRGSAYPSDETALKIAELLDLDAAYIIACIQADKAKTPGVLKVWKRLAKLSQAAAIMLLLTVLGAPTVEASHIASEHNDVTVYTLYAAHL